MLVSHVFATNMAYDVGRYMQSIQNGQSKEVGACCSSPAAICYWFIVTLIAWVMLSVAGIY
jgi:hypothetical protein